MTIDLTGSGMLALTRDTLTALRAALVRDTGAAAAGYLQEAGYAGGQSLFDAFRHWLAARGRGTPESLSVEQPAQRLPEVRALAATERDL